MTATEAIQESIRRWTLARAFAYEERNAPAEERFQVGFCDGWRDIVLGFGATWEEAFRLADQTPIDTSRELVGASPGWRAAKTRQLVPGWRKLYLQHDQAGSCGGNAAMLSSGGVGLITSSTTDPV
jgi:hypothetical protein